MGNTAGYFSSTHYSILLGYNSGFNLTGDSLIALGICSGQLTTTGYRNIFIGGYAGYNNTTGANNLVLGHGSLADGLGVARFIGSNNVFIGNSSAEKLEQGDGNVFLGYRVGGTFTNISNTLLIGNSHTFNLIKGEFDNKKLWLNGRTFINIPNSAPTDADLNANQVTAYLDEANNKLMWRVKYTDGTTMKSGEIILT